MLNSLSIRNVVLIDKLDLSFGKGLSVFTGETGSGKSILLDALSLALGTRADTGLIRHGTTQLSVTAEFSIPKTHPAHLLLSDFGLEDNNTLILRRTLSKDGKSKAFVNDEPVGIGLLKQIGDTLVEIHGQFASHGLLNPATHLDVLDSYGHLEADRKKCMTHYQEYKELQEKVSQAIQVLEKAKADEEYLKSAITELQQMNPQKGEEEKLAARRTELMNAEKITESLNNVYGALSDSVGSGVSSLMRNAARELEKANRLTDGSFEEQLQDLDKAGEIIAQFLDDLENKAADFTDPTAELERVEERLFALKDLGRKYRVPVDDLPATLADFESKIKLLYDGQEELDRLNKLCQKARLDFLSAAQILSSKRKQTALTLDKAVQKELPALKLDKATFITQVEDLPEDNAGAKGLNRVTFCVSTNAGIPPTPLHKTASGGELARFMLALKVNLSGVEEIPTLIFDEVDTGIGGATASAVGERLARLGTQKQVLVVTHSPQVAAFGTHHMKVTKSQKETAILTQVLPLSKSARLEEIARMLSGAQITDTARMAAQSLLEKSNVEKSL